MRVSFCRPIAKGRRLFAILYPLFSILLFCPSAHADKVSDISTTQIREQAFRFFTLQDTSLRYALIGSILLGITCGLLGSFIVVRKMALVGDALSHAVLQGVALGFLWAQTKDPVAIFVGATIAGLIGTTVVGFIKQTTRLKEDAVSVWCSPPFSRSASAWSR